MFRLVTIEREYGCGAASIAAQLAESGHVFVEAPLSVASVDLQVAPPGTPDYCNGPPPPKGTKGKGVWVCHTQAELDAGLRGLPRRPFREQS